MANLNVGICGLGTVGSGAFNVLQRNRELLASRSGCMLNVTHVGARRDNPNCDLSGINVSRDIFAVVNDPEVDVVLELIGGTTVAKELVEQALRNGKHVVTANKALVAEFGNELFALAQANQVNLHYEAAVAGGIPIIAALKEGLSANRIEWLAGIINGTGNFILTEMRDKGRDFADVLAEAQALGYAEADPTFDVEGIDAAHKLVILASIAFGMPLQFDGVFTEGISAIEPVDVSYAEELGYRIKHLGIARQTPTGIELRVHPTLIPDSQLIAKVDGVMNAVLVKGDAVGPTLYYGAGAGSEPTASAVVADVVKLARSHVSGATLPSAGLGIGADKLQTYPLVPEHEFQTAYYVRVAVRDEPGVLSQITNILSDSDISVEAVIQKVPEKTSASVPVIFVTNKTQEKRILDAIEEIESLEKVVSKAIKIRVEDLD